MDNEKTIKVSAAALEVFTDEKLAMDKLKRLVTDKINNVEQYSQNARDDFVEHMKELFSVRENLMIAAYDVMATARVEP